MLAVLHSEGVVVALVTGLFGTIIAVLQSHRATGKKIDAVATNAAEAREQVKNSHKTNLRDDMDALHADVREALRRLTEQSDDLRRHGSEISGIRRDFQIEREERLAVSRRVDHIYEVIATTPS